MRVDNLAVSCTDNQDSCQSSSRDASRSARSSRFMWVASATLPPTALLLLLLECASAVLVALVTKALGALELTVFSMVNSISTAAVAISLLPLLPAPSPPPCLSLSVAVFVIDVDVDAAAAAALSMLL